MNDDTGTMRRMADDSERWGCVGDGDEGPGLGLRAAGLLYYRIVNTLLYWYRRTALTAATLWGAAAAAQATHPGGTPASASSASQFCCGVRVLKLLLHPRAMDADSSSSLLKKVGKRKFKKW